MPGNTTPSQPDAALTVDIAGNLNAVRRRIEQATDGIAGGIAAVPGRSAKTDHVCLIAVSKTRPAQDVQAAFQAGAADFGENYLLEALPKIRALAHLPIRWHYIGAIQSNKTREIAAHFHWVHTVARRKIAQRLSDQCPPDRTINICLQVNVDQDPAKAGCSPDELPDLVKAVARLPHLQLRGLMTMPAQDGDPGRSFAHLARLFDEMCPVLRALPPRYSDPDNHKASVTGQHNLTALWDTLSMGMSGDLEAAVGTDTTARTIMVRIGTAIFGPRQTRANPNIS